MVVLLLAASQSIDFEHAIVLEVLRDRRRWSAVTVPDRSECWSTRMADAHQAYTGPIVTRKDALAAGLKRYFTGLPCKRGHISQRVAVKHGCIECSRITAAALHAANPEVRALCNKRFRDRHPEQVAATQKANDARPERKETQRIRASKKRVTPEGRAYRKEYLSRPEVKAKESIRRKGPIAKAAQRRHKSKPETKVKRARNMRAVRSTTVGCLNNRMAVALHRGLKSGKTGAAWAALVGYTVDELRRHLERQFLPKMSWANINLWHIDHIVPLASFSFTSVDDPEFKAAWCLANLRPLWALKNMSKGAKREFLL